MPWHGMAQHLCAVNKCFPLSLLHTRTQTRHISAPSFAIYKYISATAFQRLHSDDIILKQPIKISLFVFFPFKARSSGKKKRIQHRQLKTKLNTAVNRFMGEKYCKVYGIKQKHQKRHGTTTAPTHNDEIVGQLGNYSV